VTNKTSTTKIDLDAIRAEEEKKQGARINVM